MAKTRAHIFVSGRVQGVYFRQRTKNQAQNQGVTGWVRNLDDGRVEAVFEGEKSVVMAMLDYCRHGSKNVLVTDFAVNWEQFQGEFQSFNIVF